MARPDRRLALVTGASRGIGFELAKRAAREGFDLVAIARDQERLEASARLLRELGATVETVAADLADLEEVDRLVGRLGDRQLDCLFANAGRGLGGVFLDQPFDAVRHVIDTNITGTIYLVQRVGQLMRTQGFGRILVTGSIAGTMPAPFHAVYHASKAFIDNFTAAIRNELADDGITVTCLMPGATATDFFAEANLLDTTIASRATADPADVARVGFEALMRGDSEVIHGIMNRMAVKMAGVTPSARLADQNRKDNKPASRSN